MYYSNLNDLTGSVVGLLSNTQGIVVRSSLSKVIPSDELGRIFSMVACLEAAVPLFAFKLVESTGIMVPPQTNNRQGRQPGLPARPSTTFGGVQHKLKWSTYDKRVDNTTRITRTYKKYAIKNDNKNKGDMFINYSFLYVKIMYDI